MISLEWNMYMQRGTMKYPFLVAVQKGQNSTIPHQQIFLIFFFLKRDTKEFLINLWIKSFIFKRLFYHSILTTICFIKDFF